jgi:thymidylate synthase
MENGSKKKPSRLNMPSTTSIFGYQKRYNLQEGFPMLTTKKVFWKGVVIELLWFLTGKTNVKYLVDNNVMFWCQDSYAYYLKTALKHEKDQAINSIYCPTSVKNNVRNPTNKDDIDSYSLFTLDEFINILKTTDYEKLPRYGKYILGDCGVQYGKLWRNLKGLNGDDEIIIVDQFKDLIKSLIINPESRRHIITAWNPFTLNDMALNACHSFVQWNCVELSLKERLNLLWKTYNQVNEKDLIQEYNIPKYKLDCQLYQRSGDIFLGTPLNSASYSLLTHIVAKLTNMVVGEFIHTFGDVHLYDNLIEPATEQLTRDPNKYPLPNLILSDKFNQENLPKDIDTDLDVWLNSLSLIDFKLDNYQSYPAIKGELSTGVIVK